MEGDNIHSCSIHSGVGTNHLSGSDSNPQGRVTSIDRAWTILFARLVLGLIFFMAGVMKVFQMGPLNHARKMVLTLCGYIPAGLVALGYGRRHSVR